ncbi:MAG: 1-(5-phosphoribosyl)-5-[(5-phosphoribosylamino)methylideneamino]imidazole-4-carboxamide isomerase [Helicobacteraceae bacterium]|jgi:phosphoribosylformimino-5-aminoimidazole carboxamide ribotide isomerase|nr:1-(5-phosphoribosyl)-5-[(5-phosphoribosylamino)methylideneamino]imidazole-4-carboxamide isomerase [Helicobacteraceae bacterium]
MIVFPAIDLKENKAVRLTKGLMQSAKIYGDNPAEIAARFEEAGAAWLHIVDLDGAFAGKPKNLSAIKAIVKQTKLKTQLGGGVRDEDTINSYLDLGISRVILGSAAARNPDWALTMSQKYPIAIGIDAAEGKVATDGWAKSADIEAERFAALFKGAKIEAVIATDIGRDGTLSGANADFTKTIKAAFGGFTIASGGVKAASDLVDLAKNGIDGVIVGKAIYEGAIDVKELFNRISIILDDQKAS